VPAIRAATPPDPMTIPDRGLAAARAELLTASPKSAIFARREIGVMSTLCGLRSR
jgi:hypothetical protein